MADHLGLLSAVDVQGGRAVQLVPGVAGSEKAFGDPVELIGPGFSGGFGLPRSTQKGPTDEPRNDNTRTCNRRSGCHRCLETSQL
jgi:hypothetical protein